jgi:hypothetical protein
MSDDAIDRIVAQAPPLTDEQRTHISALLRLAAKAKGHNVGAQDCAPPTHVDK